MLKDQEALNVEIYGAWVEAGKPLSLLAFHDGYTAALAKSEAEIQELTWRLESVTAERTKLHNRCHDSARSA